MQPHQERVVEEKRELDEKISKLAAFFGGAAFIALPWNERTMFRNQLRCMLEYQQILEDRILGFAL